MQNIVYKPKGTCDYVLRRRSASGQVNFCVGDYTFKHVAAPFVEAIVCGLLNDACIGRQALQTLCDGTFLHYKSISDSELVRRLCTEINHRCGHLELLSGSTAGTKKTRATQTDAVVAALTRTEQAQTPASQPANSDADRPKPEADKPMPSLLAGAIAAARYLRSEGVSKDETRQILKSFVVPTIAVKKAGPNDYGMRFHGGPARPCGQYLTPTFGPLVQRETLALPPNWNSMSGIKQWQVKPGTTMITGKAAAQPAEGARYIGGADQAFVLRPYLRGSLL